MNDRYLYRAKRTDNGEWVKGSLCYKKAYCFDNRTKPKAVIITEYSNTGVVNFDIDENTICQCTGLRDKNGNLIWENDIVKEFNSSGDEWNLSQIVFGEYSLNLGWCTKGIKTLHEYNRRLFNVGFGTSEAGECEVIGNIFDNPELLEE